MLAPLAAAAVAVTAGLPATAAFAPLPPAPAACANPRAAADLQGDEAAALACVSQARRVELLEQPPKPTVISSITGAHRLSSALHHWKAKEAEALAVPALEERNPLDAYLEGRTIESMRREALAEVQRAILDAQARVLYLATDFKAATHAAGDWIRRQPGRDLPPAYRERIVKAAAAILVASRDLEMHDTERARVDRHFDEALERVLPQG
jgi:hypothetical protein